jgi:TonB family protein
MKIKINTYKILFRLLDFLSNSKLLHKTVINRKIYLGASIISLSMMNSGCSSDKTETKNSNDKKDSTIDNLNGNEISKSKQDSISRKNIKLKTADSNIEVEATCYLILVDQSMPEFPGGDEARIKYISTNLVKPKGTDSISGTVYVEFVVEKTGEITNVNVKREVHPLLDSEAVRVIKNMPKWIPGKQLDQTVRVNMLFPIKFASNK